MVTPTALFMFDSGLWTTTVLVAAIVSISSSSIWTQWTKMDFSPVTPSLSRRLTVGMPYFSRESFPVRSIFRHMDMAANARVLGDADTFFQGLIGDGERGVQSHHGCDLPVAFADLLDKALVLRDAAAHHVAVGDFIAQRGADACLADGAFDQVKRAIAHAGRGMVVDDRGRAVADALDQRASARKG